MTEQYLFVRSVYGDGKISDEVFEVENGRATEFKADFINYDISRTGYIVTNEENTEIQKEGELIFQTEPGESIKLKTYSDKYVFADILDEDGLRKQILFFNLVEDIGKLYDNKDDIHMEIYDDLLVAYLYGENIEIRMVDLKTGQVLNQ